MGALFRDMVRKHSKAKGSARALLNILADYATEDGRCWPGRDALANDTGMSERSVTRCLQRLVDDGRLAIEEYAMGGRGHKPVYKIVFPDCEKGDRLSQRESACHPLDKERVTGHHPLVEERVTDLQQKGDNLTVKGDKSASIPSYARSEPQLEPTTEPTAEEGEIAANAAPPSFTWTEFLEAFCWVCYGHKELGALTEKQKGMLASEAKRVLDAKFTLDDLRSWFRQKWQTHWKWTKENKHERPLPSDVRSMIPSIRDSEPEIHSNGYHVDIPGVHVLAPSGESLPVAAPPPLPPAGADDPWATALAELSPTLPGVAASYLTGSRMERGEDYEGLPLYRIVVEARAAPGVEWLNKQTSSTIRRTLGSILRQKIVVQIIAEEMEPAV